MRVPGLPSLVLILIFIICTLLLIIINNNNAPRRHTAKLTIHNRPGYGRVPQHVPVTAKANGQQDELSVLDPVAMQLHNISELSNNQSSKVPIIEEETSQAEEKKDSLAIFFILLIIVLATLVVHLLLVTEFHYMPESLAIVLLGAFIGFVLSYSRWDWREVETFNPNLFFLVLLPPIIFESGYTVNKGNFFANIVPILTFAIVGTALTAFIMGFGIYLLGAAGMIYRLTAVESFAFGSIMSAVDPVITLAIFQALKVDPQLYMLAFGESMLNDAVAIVLATTALEMNNSTVINLGTLATLRYAVTRFMAMFCVSALLGCSIGIISALLYKHVHLRKTPALEMALLLVFAYLPYGLAEALSLSGIMAILFCAIIMSQYTHFNVTPVTQLTMQLTFRTLSFVAETCTFAYLGLALFSIKLVFQPVFLVWSVILLFLSRAAHIFPLSFVVNKCVENKISLKTQIIMWFSGMRGAVAFALALHMNMENSEKKRMLLTSTLFLVLFTVIFMGGSALPLIKILDRLFPDDEQPTAVRDKDERRARTASESLCSSGASRRSRPMVLSKTQEMNLMDQTDLNLNESDVFESSRRRRLGVIEDGPKNFFTRVNENFVRPLLIRRLTKEEMAEDKAKLEQMTEALKVDFLGEFSYPEEEDPSEVAMGDDNRRLLNSTSSSIR